MKYKQINKQNIWVEKLSKKNFEDSPCLFLDRDGVLIDWKDYTMKVKDLKLTIGCDKIIKKCNKKKTHPNITGREREMECDEINKFHLT